MEKYRHKPTTVQAHQWDGTPECFTEHFEGLGPENAHLGPTRSLDGLHVMAVSTPMGDVYEALPGDWVTLDSRGVRRIVVDAVFKEEFEPVS